MDPSSMDANQQFCLRWHNYQSSLLSTLPQLLDGDDLTDVTLSAGGRNLKAHKVVLSACSQYFKQLFKEIGNCHHPVIVLPGVEFGDLCALVTFMYSGEVNIYQQQLASLLSMADTLHVRGLAEFSGEGQEYSTKHTQNNAHPNRLKRQKLSPTNNNIDLNNMITPVPVTTKTDWLPSGISGTNEVQDLSRKSNNTLSTTSSSDNSVGTVKVTPTTSTCSMADSNNNEPGISTEKSTSTTTVPSNNYKSSSTSSTKLFATCFICGKQLSNQYNLRVHMETHQNAFYACASCSHVSRSRDALRKHVSYRHPPVTP